MSKAKSTPKNKPAADETVVKADVAVAETPVVAEAKAVEAAVAAVKPAAAAKKVTAKPVAPEKPKTAPKATPKVTPKAALKVKTTVKAPEKKVAVAAETVKPAKASTKKPKLIRDSFTFPESDYSLLAALKLRALGNGHEIKKSELLRAGLIALQSLTDVDLVKVLATVERIKTGRPSKK